MNSTAKTARLMAELVEAETKVAGALREESRTARASERAADRVKAARQKLTEARKDLRAAQRAGKGEAVAARRVATREGRVEELLKAAEILKADAAAYRREARTAQRRLNRLSMRAAVAASRTVEKISHRLGETALTPAPETDAVLTAEELPAVEEIEAHALRQSDLDKRAKDLAKAADAEKEWLRQLPTGVYGRVVITRTAGRSVLDGTQVALDYTSRGLIAPRKLTRQTFKVDASALAAEADAGRLDFPKAA